jgi:ABC-type Mn2+/Zn2+ transport system permease subunit
MTPSTEWLAQVPLLGPVLGAVVGPFVEFDFMRRALVASIALALGSAPIGCLLVLRRLSLVGDALAHAVLPGAAVGFMLAGLSLPWRWPPASSPVARRSVKTPALRRFT